MRIEFAHLRERSTTGHEVNFAIFTGITPVPDTPSNNDAILTRLVMGANQMGLRVEQGAFVYRAQGQIKIWGEPFASDFVQKVGIPRMTHYMDINL